MSLETVAIHNRKYLGSKTRLLGFLEEVILGTCGRIGLFADGFSGTGVVAHRFRGHAESVLANDLLFSNYVTNRAFLLDPPADLDAAVRMIGDLNDLPPIRGYAAQEYGGTYFTQENAGRIDACREALEARTGELSNQARVVVLTSLLYAADKAANTVGQYDAFLKNLDAPNDGGDGRHLVDGSVLKPLRLAVPEIESGAPADVRHGDFTVLAPAVDADVLYLDPPYNYRQYSDLYHVLDNIAMWGKPPLAGKTRKPQHGRTRSRFSARSTCDAAMEELIRSARARHIFISYNSEGLVPPERIHELLALRGRVTVHQTDYGVFGNGAGRSRRRMVKERLYHCKT